MKKSSFRLVSLTRSRLLFILSLVATVLFKKWMRTKRALSDAKMEIKHIKRWCTNNQRESGGAVKTMWSGKRVEAVNTTVTIITIN